MTFKPSSDTVVSVTKDRGKNKFGVWPKVSRKPIGVPPSTKGASRKSIAGSGFRKCRSYFSLVPKSLELAKDLESGDPDISDLGSHKTKVLDVSEL